MDPRGRRLQRSGARSLLRQRGLPAAGFGQGNGEHRPHAVDHVLRTRQLWGETWGPGFPWGFSVFDGRPSFSAIVNGE